MANDKLLLSEFRKTIRINSKSQVIDLDEKFPIKFDFQAQRIEDIFTDTARAIPPNKWSYHRIGLVTKGSGEFITGLHKFKAPKNTLFVVPSRVISSSKNWSIDAEGYVVLFNIDFFMQNNFPHKFFEDKRILNTAIQPNIYIDDNAAKKVAHIFETILKEKHGNGKHKDELIALKVIELVIRCERIFSEQQQVETNIPSIDIVKKFIDLVEANFLTERSVAFYATQLNVHPNYLNSLIKKHMGLTAKESIQNRLLLETKFLLHSTNLTIKEISNQMGFNDPNYFTVFFKKLENISPVHYRLSFI